MTDQAQQGSRVGPGGPAWPRRLAVALLALAVLGSACGSPEERYRVLRFFFDGVPPPKAEREEPTPSPGDAKEAKGQVPRASPAPVVEGSIHPPFAKRQCNGCHGGRPGALKSDVPKLCFTCHDAAKVVPADAHDPVEEGECIACHSPHDSKWRKLLRLDPGRLCFGCHEASDERFAALHAPLGEDRPCIECHAGHGNANPGFLKSLNGALCRHCHLRGLDRRKPLHGPVAAGLCVVCHRVHRGSDSAYLRYQPDGLCLRCHPQKDLQSRFSHAPGEVLGCLRCHDPHGTGRRFMLRIHADGAKPPETRDPEGVEDAGREDEPGAPAERRAP